MGPFRHPVNQKKKKKMLHNTSVIILHPLIHNSAQFFLSLPSIYLKVLKSQDFPLEILLKQLSHKLRYRCKRYFNVHDAVR